MFDQTFVAVALVEIRRLQLGPLFRLKQPAEARSRRIDAQRVGRVLAGQFRGRQFRLLLGAVCRCCRQNGYGEAQRQAGGHGFDVLSNEHVLVSMSEFDVYPLSRNDSFTSRTKRESTQTIRRDLCS